MMSENCLCDSSMNKDSFSKTSLASPWQSFLAILTVCVSITEIMSSSFASYVLLMCPVSLEYHVELIQRKSTT